MQYIEFINKMRSFSNSLTPRKSYSNSQSMQRNIERLSIHIHEEPDSLSLSSESLRTLFNEEDQAFVLVEELLQVISNPYSTILVYPKLLAFNFSQRDEVDQVFKSTDFAEQTHGLLTLYLHKKTEFLQLQKKSRKIIEIFYKFLVIEHNQQYEQWIRQNSNAKLIGQWFYSECLNHFFRNIFRSKAEYTIFFGNYMRHGLAYLFLCGNKVIEKKQKEALKLDDDTMIQMKKIEIAYVEKYGLARQSCSMRL